MTNTPMHGHLFTRCSRFLIVFLLIALSSSFVDAQVCGYYYRKPITINGARITGGPHANFPVLISHTDAALTTASGKVKNTNGYDIIFTDNAGVALDFQLERYNGATGQVVAWVKIPSITNGTNVTIYMLYGNALITTDQSTTNTWSSGYHGVWHFNSSVNDVSGSGITSVNNGSTNQASGKIGEARNFVNPNNWVELTNFGNLTTGFTISGWVNSNDVTRDGQRIFVDDVNNTGGYGFSLGDEATPGRLRFYSRGSNPVSLDAPSFILANNTWYHVAAVADIATGIKRIYVNGVERANGAYVNAWGTDAGNAAIGGETASGETANRWHGNLDEIRVANRALSASWIATEYASHNQPTTTVGVVTAGDFYFVGTETSYGDPSQFGANSWNVYAYNGNNASDALNSYRGFYPHNTLNFNSTSLWTAATNPGNAAGYAGCTVNDDAHTVRYKRRGFPCGYYRVDIAGHDDAAQLFVDGVSVWNHNGCCDTHTGAWSGFLGANSTVEFRWTEGVGNSEGAVNFTIVPFPTLSPPVTICAGTTTTLTASGAANYSWTTNTTHLVAPYTNASVVVSPPGATPSSTQTYTVTTTDATTTCTSSNSVVVTINPLPSTAVTPTTATFCTTGSVDVTATGANTYTWSPMTNVAVTSASGHTATLTPTVTTTYTVTGSNNCTSNTATVTVTVNTITGDPAVFGTNTWNVYAYTGNNFDTYYGNYVHNTLTFDSRTLWAGGGTPSSAPGYTGCVIPIDNHSYRYKRRGFPCGYYQLDIPNHDDNVDLIINGVSVFSQASWFANVYKTNVWTGYLDTNSEIEYTIREFGGDSHAGLAFIYLYGPSNGAAQSVWTGATSTDWFTASNWCSAVPTSAIGAYIPPGTTFFPVINAAGAQTQDLTILTGASLTVNATRNLAVHGSWLNNGTFSPAGTSSVTFAGTTANTFGGSSATTFTNLTMNNSNSAALTLSSDFTVTGTLTFTAGHIITGANRVIFNDGALVSGVSDASHVSGQVRKIGNDAFTFPTGKNGYYAPIGISAPNNAAFYFTAEYFFTDPNAAGYSATSLGAGIDHISRNEYWNLDKGPGASNETVTLSWNTPRSGGVNNTGQIRVVGWSGTQWNSWGNGANTGNATAGTETSLNVATVYGPFTLASTTTNNPLPVQLLAFTAALKKSEVELRWKTANEVNNDFFTIHKSLDGTTWTFVEKVSGSGTSVMPQSYSAIDPNPVRGIQYYRLSQTDFSGITKVYPMITLGIDDLTDDMLFKLEPNPAVDAVNLHINDAGVEAAHVQVISTRDVVCATHRDPSLAQSPARCHRSPSDRDRPRVIGTGRMTSKLVKK